MIKKYNKEMEKKKKKEWEIKLKLIFLLTLIVDLNKIIFRVILKIFNIYIFNRLKVTLLSFKILFSWIRNNNNKKFKKN